MPQGGVYGYSVNEARSLFYALRDALREAGEELA